MQKSEEKEQYIFAIYFRTRQGVVHTVSASGEKVNFCLCSYVPMEDRLRKEEAHVGELFRLEKVIFDAAPENLHPGDLKEGWETSEDQ